LAPGAFLCGTFFCAALMCACPLAGSGAADADSPCIVVDGASSDQGELSSRDGVSPASGPPSISCMTYNAQTFFDAAANGCEFDEFLGAKSRWSAERYRARLDRLCEVILLCGTSAGEGPERGPDIVVLEEIENSLVIEDLCNRLPQRYRYRYLAFVPPGPGSAFSQAVLSRYPVVSVSVHSADVPNAILRPLLEVTLDADGRPFTVFAAHWKSKSGDDDGESALMRRKQEAVLRSRIDALAIAGCNDAYVACGDFNQGLDDFTEMRSDGIVNCWDDWLPRCAAGQVPGPEGSYYYRGVWETIDHIFYSDPAKSGYSLLDFRVVSLPPLTGADLIPARYEVFTGEGYSDHLPLVVALRRMN